MFRSDTASIRGEALGGSALGPGIAGGRLRLRVIAAYNLINTDLGILPGDVSEPFVVARVGTQEFNTPAAGKTLDPRWNSQTFEFEFRSEEDFLLLEVFTSNTWHSNDCLGRLRVDPKRDLTSGETRLIRERLLDVDQGELEVEVRYLSPLDVQRGVSADGPAAWAPQTQPQTQPQMRNEQQLVPARRHGDPRAQQQIVAYNPESYAEPKQSDRMVPLPSFKNFGPEAFLPPPRKPEDDAPVGERRRLQEYNSITSCHLGQYDYSEQPIYTPAQEQVDKGKWQNDPFYGWRQDLDRVEHPSAAARRARGQNGALTDKDPFHNWRSQVKGSHLGRVSAEQENENWRRDPFHGWLDKGGASQQRRALEGPEAPAAGCEQVQRVELQARQDRLQKKLPTFDDLPRARNPQDPRNYVASPPLPGARLEEAYQAGHQAGRRWKDDAFFGWLPGRGDPGEAAATQQVHRPLMQARLQRLPSFSESMAIGLRGTGVGVLKVWINRAYDLSLPPDSLGAIQQRAPSACVRLQVGPPSSESGDREERFTEIVPNDSNPVWSAPGEVFEVQSLRDMLTLEVLDQSGAQAAGRLGRWERSLSNFDRKEFASRKQHTEILEGVSGSMGLQAKICMDVQFISYGHGTRGQPMQRADVGNYTQPVTGGSQRSMGMAGPPLQTQKAPQITTGTRSMGPYPSTSSFHSQGGQSTASGGTIGMLSVRIIAGYNLVNKDSGILGDVSDPYVTMQLRSEKSADGKKKPKRTKTISNDLNPKWNTVPFQFLVKDENDDMLLEVWDEDLIGKPDFLGRMTVPLFKIIAQPGRPLRLRDQLNDIEHGELEVEIGFSPEAH